MTATGTIIRPFGAEERPFALTVGAWRDLEKARGAGLGVLAARIAPLVGFIHGMAGTKETDAGAHLSGEEIANRRRQQFISAIATGMFGSFFVDDVRETLLQGLIGGGMASTDAGALTRKVFDEAVNRGEGPAMRFAPLAFDLLTDAIIGVEGEPINVGEPKAAGPRPSRRSRKAERASAQSTGPVL